MKNKAPLSLLEQLLMLLVFALAAAICLQVFVKADSISRQTSRLDRAVVLAQNGAEVVKATKGDWETAALYLDAQISDGSLVARHDDLTLQILPETDPVSALPMAWVTVTETHTENTLFSLTVCWQEVAP